MSVGIFKHAQEFITFAPGETVFREGDPCDIMYVVQEGELDILVNGVIVETVGANGIFGEMADEQPAGKRLTVACEFRISASNHPQ